MNSVADLRAAIAGSDLSGLISSAFEHSVEARVICDGSNKIVAINRAFTRMTGYTGSEVIGRNPSFLASGQMSPAFYEKMWDALISTGTWSGELTDCRKDGTIYSKFLSITLVRDAAGNVAYYLGSFVEVSSIREFHSRLENLAHNDMLTGLLNRYAFDSLLAQNIALARRQETRIGLLYLDLDGFKKINDSLGHAVGDELLRIAAKRFRASVRDSDSVARLGGDEFAVMLSLQDVDRTGTAMVADRLLAVTSDAFEIDGHVLYVSASIGLAFFPDDADDGKQLMQHADTAMYEAKAIGKNTFYFFSRELYHRAAQRLKIEELIRRLLSTSPCTGFHVVYQPQFSLPERKIVGVEALLRMTETDGCCIPPDTFIPIAEEAGLITRLGEWVIEDVCRQIRVWIDAGVDPVPVSVNVSSRQFRSANLSKHLMKCSADYGVPLKLLVLEITESIAMDRSDQIVDIMRALKAAGVGLSIDDFGTGYSSLSYLPRLPLDTLKIDRSFVMSIEEDAGAASVSAATIALAHTLGLKVVAEGVETEAQARFLSDHACDAVQGYLLGRPVQPEQLKEMMLGEMSPTDIE